MYTAKLISPARFAVSSSPDALGVAVRRWTLSGIVFAACMVGSVSADPSAARKATAAAGPLSNLKVLPIDSSYIDIVLMMNAYSRELGVQCSFCHAQDPKSQVIDFASDQSPAKLVARVMIGMVRDINEKYLAQVNDRRYASPITCGNCHQGRTFPPAYEPGPG
jgi:Photosynthetic reaction centre cytochrome C subunit